MLRRWDVRMICADMPPYRLNSGLGMNSRPQGGRAWRRQEWSHTACPAAEAWPSHAFWLLPVSPRPRLSFRRRPVKARRLPRTRPSRLPRASSVKHRLRTRPFRRRHPQGKLRCAAVFPSRLAVAGAFRQRRATGGSPRPRAAGSVPLRLPGRQKPKGFACSSRQFAKQPKKARRPSGPPATARRRERKSVRYSRLLRSMKPSWFRF